jgi:hypothetical protein
MACALAALVAGCATPDADTGALPDDPLCADLAEFARAAARDGGAREVAYATDWGGAWTEEEVMYAVDCQHDGYEPGRKLCGYLMENTSIEFPEGNVRAVLACFGEAAANADRNAPLRVPFRRRSLPGLPVGIEIRVDFREPTDSRPPTLVISARK